VLSPRLVAIVKNPIFFAVLVYLVGVALRVEYSLNVHRPESFIESDMQLYVQLARRIAGSNDPLMPWDVTHPLGYPALMAHLISDGGSLSRVVTLQIIISSLVPLALGLLGAAAFGRLTGLLAVVIASIYFPFIEYGALFLSEIHFIFWLALAFAAFFAAKDTRRLGASLGLAAAGGLCLSIAISMKSVGLLAGLTLFAAEAVALLLDRRPGGPSWRARLKPWLLRAVVAGVAAAPLLGVLTRVCTQANRGNFCVTGNKVGSDFLLGHYGRIADIAWAPDDGHAFQFGSPSAFLRHYPRTAHVPFPMTDNAANRKEAWRWIFKYPGEAAVLSLDHIYDTFFGPVMWPSFNHPSWPLAHLSQYAFVVLLLAPTLFACARVAKRGVRAFVTSRTALVLSPVVALTVTVAIATGENRYRIPFDIFFIIVVSAFAVSDLTRVDGISRGGAPRS
jgi:4-amino-4-deoxy-L-arabinose transferase-like glycosyltransferase